MMVIRGDDPNTGREFNTAGTIETITAAAAAVITISTAAAVSVFGSGDTALQADDILIVSGVTGETAFNTSYKVVTFNSSSRIITTDVDSSGFAGTPVFTAATLVANKASDYLILPADRCTWHQITGVNGGYAIAQAEFFAGDSSSGKPINKPRLGFIGKSGRFVEIAS